MLAIQLLVPLRALLDDSDPRRPFGWSMYATETRYPDIVVVLDDGARRGIPFGAVVARRRPEVDYAGDLPPHLCERVAGARSVELTFDDPEPEVTPCR